MGRFRELSASVLAIVVSLVLAGCSSLRAEHDYDPPADFSGYKTFSWIGPRPLLEGGQSPLLEGRLMRITDEALRSKGYHFVPDPEDADFVVAFTVGSRDKVRVDSYPTAYRHSYRWGGYPYQASQVSVRQYTEGRLSIDIFDVKRHGPVWHGWATKTITSKDQADPEALIRDVIGAIMVNFPPP
jgi:hypothetical protein